MFFVPVYSGSIEAHSDRSIQVIASVLLPNNLLNAYVHMGKKVFCPQVNHNGPIQLGGSESIPAHIRHRSTRYTDPACSQRGGKSNGPVLLKKLTDRRFGSLDRCATIHSQNMLKIMTKTNKMTDAAVNIYEDYKNIQNY